VTYYVRRKREARKVDVMAGLIAWDAKTAWTGPLPTLKRAQREADAWIDAGWSSAEVIESSPEIKREVRAWQKDRNTALGRAS
jgi:hypothetical protein